MAELTERDVLNRLVQTCRDGEHGFRYAANHVHGPEVKALFLEIASQRDQFATELLPHTHRLGGTPAPAGSIAGALHRGWITIKDAIGHHDDATIIKEAERGERMALAAYEDALDGVLHPITRPVIERQCTHIRHSHSRVHAMLLAIVQHA